MTQNVCRHGQEVEAFLLVLWSSIVLSEYWVTGCNLLRMSFTFQGSFQGHAIGRDADPEVADIWCGTYRCSLILQRLALTFLIVISAH